VSIGQAFPMTGQARQATPLRPSAVAIHDKANMTGRGVFAIAAHITTIAASTIIIKHPTPLPAIYKAGFLG